MDEHFCGVLVGGFVVVVVVTDMVTFRGGVCGRLCGVVGVWKFFGKVHLIYYLPTSI